LSYDFVVLGYATTFIINGRKQALKEAYDRSLNVKYSSTVTTLDMTLDLDIVENVGLFLPG
jgi:hypothetical protein